MIIFLQNMLTVMKEKISKLAGREYNVDGCELGIMWGVPISKTTTRMRLETMAFHKSIGMVITVMV